MFICVLRYDSRRVVQQLRACGVLETIRVSAQSYPSRWFSITRFQIIQITIFCTCCTRWNALCGLPLCPMQVDVQWVLQPLQYLNDSSGGRPQWQETDLQERSAEVDSGKLHLWYLLLILIMISYCVLCFLNLQDSNQYKFGRTKIFFRAGQVAYLEKLRLDRLRGACVTIQKHVRGWSQRRKYLHTRQATIVIQQYIRGIRTIRLEAFTASSVFAWIC